MSTIAVKQARQLVAEGPHCAVCCAVYDIGIQPGFKDGPPRGQHVYFFEIDEFAPEGPYAGEHRVVSMRMSDSLHPKSRLHGAVRAMKGGLTGEETAANSFDPESLIGLPCTIDIEHVPGDDGTMRARIMAIRKHDASKPVIKPTFDRSSPPDWVLDLQAEALGK